MGEYAWVDAYSEAIVPAQPKHTIPPPAPVNFEQEYAWVDVIEVKQRVPTSASSAHRDSGRPSTSGEWREQPRHTSASLWDDVEEYRRPDPIVSTSTYGQSTSPYGEGTTSYGERSKGGGSSFTSSSYGQWE